MSPVIISIALSTLNLIIIYFCIEESGNFLKLFQDFKN